MKILTKKKLYDQVMTISVSVISFDVLKDQVTKIKNEAKELALDNYIIGKVIFKSDL